MNSPFSNNTIRDWFVKHSKTSDIKIDAVVTLGSGPFEESEFDEFLRQNGIQPFEPSEEIETVVVGTDQWEEQTLLQMLTLRKGKTLKVYSHEMFLAYLLSGADPFKSGKEMLKEFADGHPALQFLSDVGFQWPSTYVTTSNGDKDLTSDWPKKGFLGYLNYRVGRKGLTRIKRQTILSRAFKGGLPPGLPENYLNEWGRPASPQRLKKIANSIATFCRNAKRRESAQTELAIKDWQTDLGWLKQTFYDPSGFRFRWPETEV